MGTGDDRFFSLALGSGGFADPDLALVVRMFEFTDLAVELRWFPREIGALGRLLLLALGRLGEALVGIFEALAPLGLFATGSAKPLAVGGSLASLGRRFGALVGDRRSLSGGIGPSGFEVMFENSRVR